jgi:hypothetical protein
MAVVVGLPEVGCQYGQLFSHLHTVCVCACVWGGAEAGRHHGQFHPNMHTAAGGVCAVLANLHAPKRRKEVGKRVSKPARLHRIRVRVRVRVSKPARLHRIRVRVRVRVSKPARLHRISSYSDGWS